MNEDDVLTIEQVRQQLDELSQELDSSSANAERIRERILMSYQRLLDAAFEDWMDAMAQTASRDPARVRHGLYRRSSDMAARRFYTADPISCNASPSGPLMWSEDYDTLATLAEELAQAVETEGTAKSKTRALARKVLKALEER